MLGIRQLIKKVRANKSNIGQYTAVRRSCRYQ